MDIVTHQRQMAALINQAHPADNGDAYLRTVAESPSLAMMQDIVVWWREFGIERACPLTSALLKQRQIFDDTVSAYVREHVISPFMEQLGADFLLEMSRHQDELLASVAQFEAALLKVRQGDLTRYEISWSAEPYTVIASLLQTIPFNPDPPQGHYTTVVHHHIPNFFCVFAHNPASETCVPVGGNAC